MGDWGSEMAGIREKDGEIDGGGWGMGSKMGDGGERGGDRWGGERWLEKVIGRKKSTLENLSLGKN